MLQSIKLPTGAYFRQQQTLPVSTLCSKAPLPPPWRTTSLLGRRRDSSDGTSASRRRFSGTTTTSKLTLQPAPTASTDTYRASRSTLARQRERRQRWLGVLAEAEDEQQQPSDKARALSTCGCRWRPGRVAGTPRATPVCSLPPTGPTISVKRRSLAVWMSSSPTLLMLTIASGGSDCGQLALLEEMEEFMTLLHVDEKENSALSGPMAVEFAIQRWQAAKKRHSQKAAAGAQAIRYPHVE